MATIRDVEVSFNTLTDTAHFEGTAYYVSGQNAVFVIVKRASQDVREVAADELKKINQAA